MPTLDGLPSEVLDTIVPHLDLGALFRLCHALPALKPVSASIHNAAEALQMDFAEASHELWPSLEIGTEMASCPEESYFTRFTTNMLLFQNLASLLNRFHGSVQLLPCCTKHLHSIQTILPRRLSVTLSLFHFDGFDPSTISDLLAALPSTIHFLDLNCSDEDPVSSLKDISWTALTRKRIHTLHWPQIVADDVIVASIIGLSHLILDSPRDFNLLASCRNLQRVELWSHEGQECVLQAILEETHPKLRRVEVRYDAWTTDGYTLWNTRKRAQGQLSEAGWTFRTEKTQHEARVIWSCEEKS